MFKYLNRKAYEQGVTAGRNQRQSLIDDGRTLIDNQAERLRNQASTIAGLRRELDIAHASRRPAEPVAPTFASPVDDAQAAIQAKRDRRNRYYRERRAAKKAAALASVGRSKDGKFAKGATPHNKRKVSKTEATKRLRAAAKKIKGRR